MHGVRFLAFGPKACFSRPEFKVERVSYEVPTANAARGIIEAVYWHPGITWHVDRIHIINQMRLVTEMHNELEGQQRNTTLLRDVCYGIEAHFDSKNERPGKVLEQFTRRVRKGQHYRQPCFGLREYEAHLQLVDGEMPRSFYKGTEVDLGWMLYEIDYDHPGAPSSYVHLRMTDGVVDIAKAIAEGKVAR